ncbi:helix-turn-helix transcriptional regulator [Ochrobactrum sp. AN78]|uniref:helix-turn-helix domain-containing protein n=1 Tax=Ochrobactrum sp. AN78 TaxID=3039853 RepID=UPI002989C080|nr:helix-turn-helix transcriptional regulator [Ochrobactrum sp. AN78]MDH7793899.1 DNA-binding XRE family transcriptional regulator [Ochrobactrum sp. AN78]
MDVQIITTPDGNEMAVLPKADYDSLLEALRDKQDVLRAEIFRLKVERGDEELIPAEYVNRMIDGENKIKVWRDFRGMTAKALADAAGLSAPYVSQIESGAREGSLDAMKKIAEALKIAIDEIV